MSEQETTTPDSEKAGGAEMAGCCGPEMAEMMKSCPCGSFIKKHWAAALVIFDHAVRRDFEGDGRRGEHLAVEREQVTCRRLLTLGE